jgi:effector-binding domain-containing protein
MRFLKIFLLIILAVVAAYIVFCFLGPKDFNISRSVTVGTAPGAVFGEVADFSKWNSWSPWNLADTAMQRAYAGEPGTVGHKNEWVSESQGSGSQEIVEVRPGEFIRTELRFKGWDEPNYSNWLFEEAGDSTRVTWTMEGSEIPFFFRGLMMIMGGRSMLEKDYETGLANLRSVAEALPRGILIEIVSIEDTPYVGRRFSMNVSQIDSALYAKTFGELIGAIGGPQNIAGMPLSITHRYDQATGDMEFEIAVPVAPGMAAPAGFTAGTIPAGRCARHVFTGPYAKSGEAWGQFMPAVMSQHKPRWSAYEVYANDPADVNLDPSQYITWLMQPVE